MNHDEDLDNAYREQLSKLPPEERKEFLSCFDSKLGEEEIKEYGKEQVDPFVKEIKEVLMEKQPNDMVQFVADWLRQRLNDRVPNVHTRICRFYERITPDELNETFAKLVKVLPATLLTPSQMTGKMNPAEEHMSLNHEVSLLFSSNPRETLGRRRPGPHRKLPPSETKKASKRRKPEPSAAGSDSHSAVRMVQSIPMPAVDPVPTIRPMQMISRPPALTTSLVLIPPPYAIGICIKNETIGSRQLSGNGPVPSVAVSVPSRSSSELLIPDGNRMHDVSETKRPPSQA